jgi:oligosaccharide reducing-end xylanase
MGKRFHTPLPACLQKVTHMRVFLHGSTRAIALHSAFVACSVLGLLAAGCSAPAGAGEAVLAESPVGDTLLNPSEGAPVVPVNDPNAVASPGMEERPAIGLEPPAELPLDPGAEPGEGQVAPPAEPPPAPAAGRTTNLFTELLGIPEAEVDEKLTLAVNRFFGIGTGESTTPVRNTGYRVYYELPQDPSRAFIWAADTNDVRSEGMSYGMMIALQMDMQDQFNRLWRFAQTHMQFPGDATGNVAAWRYYFKWQGRVDTTDAADWVVTYGGQTGPAPDGEEYFAAALYLADRRWGSAGEVNYEQDADNLARAMLNNAPSGSRTPVINPAQNMVVFYPNGNTANYSDPSYHLPAFYELFALDGASEDSERWRQVAEVSRGFLVSSAHPSTGLHPDYANFDGTPNTGGSNHDQFRFDAWRVVMNMALDYAWFSADSRMKSQVEKYHAFFADHLADDDVSSPLFELDGSNPSAGGSTALTATLGAGALASGAPNRIDYVDNLWRVQQQQGEYRYYQESVYLLGLLSTAGRFNYSWVAAP